MAGEALDTLFGAGTYAAFTARMDISAQFPGVTSVTADWPAERGSVGTETLWAKGKVPVAVYRLNYAPPVVHCVALVVEPGFRGKGVLTQLCSALNLWWPTLGLTKNTMVCDPGSNAERMLRLAGFDDLGDGTWGCHLPSTRLEEAVAYQAAKKAGGNPAQPVWREALPAPTAEPF